MANGNRESDANKEGKSAESSVAQSPEQVKELEAARSAERVAPELRDREDFINGQKRDQKEVKEGKRASGISRTFGKVVLEGIDDLVSGVKAVAVEIGEAMAREAEAQKQQLEQAKAKVDRGSMEQITRQAHDAEGKIDYESRGGVLVEHVRKHPAVAVLESKSQAEREVFKEVFEKQFGISVEEHFGKQPGGERVLRMLARRDASFKEIPADKQGEIFEKAEALDKAFARADAWGREGNVDKTTVFGVLEKLGPEERKALAIAYREVTGKDLEDVLKDRLTGSEEEKAINYLKYGSRDVAGQVHLALTKDHDQDLRDSIRTMTSAQIAQLDAELRDRFGKGLRESIMEDGGISDTSKKMLDIYMKGADRRTPEDWQVLIDIAVTAKQKEVENLRGMGGNAYAHIKLDTGDLKLLAEVMSSKVMPPEFRKQWLEGGGKATLEKAFPQTKLQALDYAEYGLLTTGTKLAINTDVGLFGDDKEEAIERGLLEMPDQERALYLKGARVDQRLAKLDMFTVMRAQDELSAEERKALKHFNYINEKISSPANGDERHKWEDMAVHPGGGAKALEDLKNKITESDWKLLSDLETRDAHIDKLLRDMNIDLMSPGTLKRAEEMLDQVANSTTFEDTKRAGNPSIVKLMQETTAAAPAVRLYLEGRDTLAQVAALAPGSGACYVESQRVFAALKDMNLADRKKYREDEKFRQSVDRWVALSLRGDKAHIEAAMSLLGKVREGKAPIADPADEINIEAGNSETNEARVIRLTEQAFRRSEAAGEKPTLYERLTNPQNDADKALKEQYEKAWHRALEDDEYKAYLLPLLKTGQTSLEFRMGIHKEEDSNRKTRFEDILAMVEARDPVSQADRQRFVSDPEYQKRVLEILPPDQRAVALKILTQAAMKPEDLTRAFVLGLGPTKQQVMQMYEGLSPEDNEKFRSEYARAYGSDVVQDLTGKLTGKDEIAALREVRRDAKTSQEAFYDARQDAYKARSGWGSDFTDGFTGSGYMVDNSVSQMGANVEQVAVTGKELSREEIKKLQEAIYANTDLFIEDREAVADALADIVITGIGIVVPGGMSLRLLMLSTGGGIGKVVVKAGVMGENYNGAVLKDFASGFADTAFSALGPGQIAKLAGLGRKVATEAGERVVASAVGKSVIKEGGEAVLDKELRGLAAQAVSSGVPKITDDMLTKVVNKVARKEASVAEREALRDAIKAEFEAGIKNEIKSGFRKYLTGTALDVGGGVVGGVAGGVVGGVFEWDSQKSFSENMQHVLDKAILSGTFAAMGALAFSTTFKVAGASWRALHRKDIPTPAGFAEPQMVAREGDSAIVRPTDAPAPSGKAVDVAPDTLQTEFQRIGDSDYYMNSDGIFKMTGEGPNGTYRLVRDEQAIIAVSEETAVRVEKASASAEQQRAAKSDEPRKDISSEGRARAEVPGEIDLSRRGDAELGKRARVTGKNNEKVEVPDKDGKMVKVDGGSDRVYEINGKRYELVRDRSTSYEKPHGDAFYYPKPRGLGAVSDVKVHVTALDGPDLAKLQEILIPALYEDPILRQYVRTWKTFDPHYGTGNPDARGMKPTGKNQQAKGFTVYGRTDEHTEIILNRIDEILAEHPELKLNVPADTGNVDFIPSNSRTNRVGRVRDHFEASPDVVLSPDDPNFKPKAPLVKIHDVVRARAHADFGVAPDGRLLPDQLNELERRAGLAPDTLGYDSRGNLVLKTTERSDIGKTGEVYAMEGGIDKRHGHRRDRPAIYALHNHYAIDPADLVGFKLKGKQQLSAGQLRELEKKSGLDPNTLDYEKGKLVYLKKVEKTDAPPAKVTPADSVPGDRPPARIPEGARGAPVMQRGDEVVYKREQFQVAGFDGRTGDVIVHRQDRKGIHTALRVTPDELGSKYPEIEINGQTRYRDKDGNVYKLVENPNGNLLLREHEYLVVQRGDVRPDAGLAKKGDRLAIDADAPRAHDVLPPQMQDSPEATAFVLLNGAVQFDGAYRHGNSGRDLYKFNFVKADGSLGEAVFRPMQAASGSPARFRKELAAFHLNQTIGFDNGFPATVERSLMVNGEMRRGWLQEVTGRTLDDTKGGGSLRELAAARYKGSGSDDDVSRLLKDDPELKDQFEQAFLERMIYGDTDDHGLNMVLAQTLEGPIKVKNIDLDQGFSRDIEPRWGDGSYMGTTARLFQDFGGQTISSKNRERIRNFVKEYASPEKRSELAMATGLTLDETNAVLARASFLAEGGKFPKYKTEEEVLAEMRRRNRALTPAS